ncbi:hypothetical protein ECG_03733 [Echinococcus granulosus]|nr:hypothetical protein ECG_03733 [Echinococcus granulosus]
MESIANHFKKARVFLSGSQSVLRIMEKGSINTPVLRTLRSITSSKSLEEPWQCLCPSQRVLLIKSSYSAGSSSGDTLTAFENGQVVTDDAAQSSGKICDNSGDKNVTKQNAASTYAAVSTLTGLSDASRECYKQIADKLAKCTLEQRNRACRNNLPLAHSWGLRGMRKLRCLRRIKMKRTIFGSPQRKTSKYTRKWRMLEIEGDE